MFLHQDYEKKAGSRQVHRGEVDLQNGLKLKVVKDLVTQQQINRN